jgi:hypothetical protein
VLDLVLTLALEQDVRNMAKDFVARGDDDGLAALRKELPTYVIARAGKDVAAELGPVVMRALDETIAEARPDVSSALQELRELEIGMPRVLTGFSQAEYMIKQSEMTTVVPSWNPKDADILVQTKPVGS